MSSSSPIFAITNLTQQFNGITVLDIPHLTFEKGKIYCFYGPNGAGKTTLFEILTRLQTPRQGTILFHEQEIFPGDQGLANLRSQVTLVNQDPLLFDTTVERNVDYGLRVRKMAKSMRKKRVAECLELVALQGFHKRKARHLSGGETQRVAIARALAIQPEVLFLDEFLANIDQANRDLLEHIIHTINHQFGTTIIFTTHYLDQAYHVADEVIHLFRGKVVRSPVKNIFHGTIQKINDLSRFSTPNITIEILTAHEGPATVAIPPEVIGLSIQPLNSSMRNHFHGQITHIIDAGNHIDLRVMAGESFEVAITKESFHEMDLYPGMSVYLYFKATSVEVF